MLVRKLDLDAVYNHGHDAVALPRSQFSRLLAAIQGLEWTTDPSGSFSRIPTFLAPSALLKEAKKADQERAMNAAALQACPEAIVQAARSLLMDSSLMGQWIIPHRPELRFVSIWDGAEDLDWHWDGPAGADFFFLIYLNKESGWPANEGGQLMVGTRSLEGNFMRVDPQAVKHQATYDPATRTLICCNNQSPQFVHKVVPLTNGRERTVFMIGFDMCRFT